MFNPKGENTMKLEKLTITQLKDYSNKLTPCTYSLEFKGVRFAVISEESRQVYGCHSM